VATLKRRRLPRPAKPTRPRCEIDEPEQVALEDLAHACGLSVASLMRVLVVDATEHPERVEAWKAIAERLARAAPPAQPKPGRPRQKKAD
jgi:hypothetical protein